MRMRPVEKYQNSALCQKGSRTEGSEMRWKRVTEVTMQKGRRQRAATHRIRRWKPGRVSMGSGAVSAMAR